MIVWMATGALDGVAGPDQDVLYVRSLDNGDTWTTPTFLNSNAFADTGDDWFPQIQTDRRGRWICVWSTNDSLGGTKGTDFDVVFSYSDDNGATWSPLRILNSGATTDLGDDGETGAGLVRMGPRIATDRNGTWVVVWSHWDSSGTDPGGTDPDILYSRSIDNGLTWSPQAFLNSDALTDTVSGIVRADLTPEIATDARGNWLVAWRSQRFMVLPNYESDIMVARSTDNGLTWPVQVPLNVQYSCDVGWDDNPAIATDEKGKWIIAWESNDSAFGGNPGGVFGDYKIVYATSSNLDGFAAASLNRPILPPEIHANETPTVGWVLRNDGNTTWTLEEGFALKVVSDPCGLITTDTLAMASGAAAAPGENYVFSAVLHAPNSPTTCTLTLQMSQGPCAAFGDQINEVIPILPLTPTPNRARDWALYE